MWRVCPQRDRGRGGGAEVVRAVVSPTDRSEVVSPVGLVDRLSTMGAVGTAGELQDRRAVDEAVEERRGQGRITEIIGPGLEVDVGRQRG